MCENIYSKNIQEMQRIDTFLCGSTCRCEIRRRTRYWTAALPAVIFTRGDGCISTLHELTTSRLTSPVTDVPRLLSLVTNFNMIVMHSFIFFTCCGVYSKRLKVMPSILKTETGSLSDVRNREN